MSLDCPNCVSGRGRACHEPFSANRPTVVPRCLWAHVFLGNTGSEKVLQKLGFRYEGCTLKSFFVRNTWFDLQTFAMLESEWEKRAA